MRVTRAFGAGIVWAALAAGTAQAQAPELSVSQRLADRREVAAGTRAQVLGFQDGRFYAQGWHITGEMGGIVTPPLKLVDAVSFGVDGEWVGPARRFTSGHGYVRYDLPSAVALPAAPHRRRPRRPARRAARASSSPTRARSDRTARVMVDVHSELMTQYPWGFAGTVPNASDNAQDTGAFEDGTLVFRDTGRLPGEERDHSYTAIVGSNRTPLDTASLGPGHYGPFGAGRRCAADQTPAPMPSQCDDGPFGRGTGGQLRFDVPVAARPLRHAVDRRRGLRQLGRPRRGRSSPGSPPGPPGCSRASVPRAPRSAAGRRS